jgi:hypothetical protein
MKKDRLSSIVISIFIFLLAACTGSDVPIRKIGSLDVGTAYQVSVQDGFAYLATNEGVVVIDIQQPDRPKKTALIETTEAAFGVVVQGDQVFVASPVDGLVIADIQNKSDPQIIGTFADAGINEVCVNESIVYAGTQSGNLDIINIEDPANPYLLETYMGNGGSSLMVACFQDVVYYSLSEIGVIVLDVSNPSSPVNTMTIPNTQGAKDAQFVEDLLYLSCVGNGVRILSVAEPLAPTTIASFNDGGEAWGIGGDSHHLWIGDLQEGIKLFDVSDPRLPELVAQDQHYAPHDLFFNGDYAYLADQDRGFIILEYVEGIP